MKLATTNEFQELKINLVRFIIEKIDKVKPEKLFLVSLS